MAVDFVVVFDEDPTPRGIPNPNPVYGAPVTPAPGPVYGSPITLFQGRPGDQNVIVLERTEPIPDDIRNYQIIYRLLEDL